MTSELRPAVEVWRDAMEVHALAMGRWAKTRECPNQAAAAVIEADRAEAATQLQALAARVKVLEAEVERLRLDVEAQEALQVSAYHAGLKAGWNFCVDDNHEGQQAAMASTDHIKELRRIREARAALKGTEQ